MDILIAIFIFSALIYWIASKLAYDRGVKHGLRQAIEEGKKIRQHAEEIRNG